MLARLANPVRVLLVEALAFAAAFGLFGLFLLGIAGANPLGVFADMWTGSYGTRFGWPDALTRSAPLMLTALCTALPARVGLIVIGNEGALLLGGLGGVLAVVALGDAAPAWVSLPLMLLAGAAAGGVWIGLVGALRRFRGVNETISSLLLFYVALAVYRFFVEDLVRDPASLNKPSTYGIGGQNMVGRIPGIDVHWGLAVGVLACVVSWVVLRFSTFGFAARVIGGSERAARGQGLPIARTSILLCVAGGAAAGLAGILEVAVAEGSANASLNAGYGIAGILVAFVARQNPLAIIPVALLFGGIEASGGLVQRRHELPDATADVFTGILFVCVLAAETLQGRFRPLVFLKAMLPPPGTSSGAPAAPSGGAA